MRQRGRQSTASLSVVTTLPSHVQRLQPPADLDDTEAALFREIVAGSPPTHFAASDAPLLATYVQAIRISRRAAEASATDASHVATWERAARVVASLATRLRLSPHSRVDAKTLGRLIVLEIVRPPSRPPWTD
jgi:hypothetical protein